MKKTLLSLLFCALIFSVSAQTDITPSRYVFSNQPVGKYKIDAISPERWNTPANWVKLDNDNAEYGYKNGFIAIGIDNVSKENEVSKAIYEGINIVDMGGEVGKCLVIRGNNSNYKVGNPMGENYKGNGITLSFYTGDKKSNPNAGKRVSVRVKMMFSIADNSLSETESVLSQGYLVTYSGTPHGHGSETNSGFPGTFFAKLDDGAYAEDDEGNYIYDPTVWEVLEYDITNVDDFPLRLKVEMKGFSETTMLIKELKFTVNPKGKPENRKRVILKPAITGVQNHILAAELNYTTNGNVVTFHNAKSNSTIEIFSLNGQLVKSLNTSGNKSTMLNSGFYIAKSGSSVAKIIVK